MPSAHFLGGEQAMSDAAETQENKPAESPRPQPVLTWTSAQLLGDANTARIEHAGEVYRLLRTRNGKLILVK